jgi:hypothetical protein
MGSEKQRPDERRIVRAFVPGMGDGSNERSTSLFGGGIVSAPAGMVPFAENQRIHQ